MPHDAASNIELCVNLCEVTHPEATPDDLEAAVGNACTQAGFPHCERVYVGSYFCENYFCQLGEAFHEALAAFCMRYDVRATLVVPLAGQAFLERVERLVDDALVRYGFLYDEVVANDVASYLALRERYGQRVGLGRLFSKEMRDARIEALMSRCAAPSLSAEARECLEASSSEEEPAAKSGRGAAGPLIELDPVAETVDVSRVLQEAPQARIAMHVPLCYATTGRNCSAASIDEPVSGKFRMARDCSLQCLRIDQGYRTGEDARYVKHGRTFFFENPGCAITGTGSWRVVYQAGLKGVLS